MGKFRINKERAISIIPKTETTSADSFGRIIQLRTAPATGIKNFQILSSETLTPGRRNNVFQMEMAAADKKLSQASETKYSGGNDHSENPSMGIEIKNIASPPIKRDDEVKINGEIVCRLRAITTLVIPEVKLFSSR